MKKSKIKDLNSLNIYIAELENKELQAQEKLQKNWDFLKSDFGGIVRASILHKVNIEGRASFLYWLFKIPTFNSTIGKTAEKLTVKLENLLVKWIDKIAE